jgi:hypothetical protein
MNKLENLVLWWWQMEKIESGAFNGLTKLTDLDMWGNEINEITPGTFKNISNLEYLDLSYNRLNNLHSDLFCGLVNLRYINLAGNKLQRLHPDTFFGLPNLQGVSLNNNPELQIPTDGNFINSHSLSQLAISDCNVSSVSAETFANVSALELLDLSYNYLRTVDINTLRALPKLYTLYLYGNPLQCDCQLREVWRFCQDRNIRAEDVECDTPSGVNGVWWGVLEEGECLQGNMRYFGDFKNISHNDTDTEGSNEYDSEFIRHHEVAVYAVPLVFGTIGNVILIIIITCNKDMRTTPNMYILNLATSDITYLTVLFSEACASTIFGMWQDNDFICRLFLFCRRLSVGLSAYSVAVLSIQRYKVIVNPFHVLVSAQPTWRATAATICGVWIVAVLFAIPSALSKHMCEGFMIKYRITYYQRVVIFELLVSCVLPLCVIAFSYIMIAHHLVVNSRSFSEGTRNPQLNIRRNSAKIVVGLAVVFLISYVPYHALWTYINFTYDSLISFQIITNNIFNTSNYELRYPYLISTFFLLINSCLNPVALFCTSSPFRQHLKRYLTYFCKTNYPLTELELSGTS